MRRSSTDHNYLRLILISIFLVLYQILSSLYTFMPLFIGLFFCYIIINFKNENSKLYVYLSFAYLSVYDLDKGFYLFSSIVFLLLFYSLFVERIRNFFTCSNCILAIYVTSAYLGHFVLNVFISYILNQDRPMFSQEYFYYIIFDIILATILFKGRV